MARIQYQRSSQPNREDPYADDEGWSPSSGAGNSVGAEAEKTLHNIDSALQEAESLKGEHGAGDQDQSLNERESAASQDQLGVGFTGVGAGATAGERASLASRLGNAAKGAGKAKTGFWNKRRAGIGGGIVGTMLLGGVLMFSPTALLYKLAKVGGLVRSADFASQEDAGNGRISAFWRYWRTGDATELRLGGIGSRIAKSLDAKLAEKGITITRASNGTGYMSSIVIDTTQSDLYTGTRAEQLAAAEKDWKGAKSIKQISDRKIAITVPDQGAGGNLFQLKASAKLARLTKAGLLSRAVMYVTNNKRFYISGNPLDPWHTLDKKTNKAVADKYKQWRQDRDKRLGKISSSKGIRAFDVLRNSKPGKIALTGLSVTGLVCAARTIYIGVGDAAYYAEAIPDMRLAADYLSAKSQMEVAVMTGRFDIQVAQYMLLPLEEVDALGNHVSDALDAAPARAADGETGGVQPPDWLKAAYGVNATASALLNNDVVKHACTGFAGAVVFSAGLLAGFMSNGILSTASGIIIGGAGLVAAQKLAIQLLTPQTEQIAAGALEGNKIFYGGAALGADNGIGYGGVALSPNQVSELYEQTRALETADFQSKSLASRLFGKYDPNSLVGRVAVGLSSRGTINIMNFASSLPSIGQSILHSFGALLPSAKAREIPYDYGFAHYGFSQEDLDNPLIQDPYENGRKVAELLDNNQIDKAKAQRCFGAIILKDSKGKWGVKVSSSPEDTINFLSPDYDSVGCADKGNNTWLRLRFFILDSRTSEGYACYDGDDEACAWLDVPSVVNTTTTNTSASSNASAFIPTNGLRASLAATGVA